ncbi:hypothetical protein SAMN05421831_10750 [Allopseudospirillum japonicum]|uniref:Uncharacterized protein n=1 Tax=Allopseudospirillum japonicum TaxID=64971 RepID=A0A1H6SV16_9GAMM|nr:hypothetical protein [Allopseudospirillum japonicum]SEI67432.1 hypothetical protein SAMN05421831_10750 [Allopseudospirillum japonicum]
MDAETIISLIASIASLVLAIVAIWLSLHQKKETDAVNENTKQLLIEIRTDAKAISNVAMPELRAYGESMRNYVFHVKDGGKEIEESSEIIDSVKRELDELKQSKQISQELSEKINRIESKLDASQTAIKKGDEFPDENSLIIDLSEFGYNEMEAEINQFDTVQDLLNTLYFSFLKDHVGPYTYNKQWVIEDVDAQQKVSSFGKADYRTLPEAGIMGGVTYRVKQV